MKKKPSIIHAVGLEGVKVVDATVVDTGEKRIHVYSDYNPAFVQLARKLNGSWLASKKAWSFDARDKERVLDALREVYGTDGQNESRTVDVKLFLDNINYGQSLFMFGREIMHTWGRDSKVQLGQGVTVLEGRVRSGGSRKNPRLSADSGTVLLVRDIPEPLIEKEPTSAFEVVGSQKADNPGIDLLALEFEALEIELLLLDFSPKKKDQEPVMDIREVKRTFTTSVIAKSVNKEITVECDEFIGVHLNNLRFRAFGAAIGFEIKKDRKCITISSFDFKKAKSAIEAFFNRKLDDGNLAIVIDDDSWAHIESLKRQHVNDSNTWHSNLDKEASQLPTYYTMHYALDWGDYVSNTERSINLCREHLPVENNDVIISQFKFWNNRIGEYNDEWEKDWKKVGSDQVSEVRISDELAKKWIAIHDKITKAEEAAEQEKKHQEDEAKQKEAERRKNIFRQAHETGKPVELYSYFVSGDSVPRRYRDIEDNDMGNIVTYAMPDGSTSEKFFPSY